MKTPVVLTFGTMYLSCHSDMKTASAPFRQLKAATDSRDKLPGHTHILIATVIVIRREQSKRTAVDHYTVAQTLQITQLHWIGCVKTWSWLDIPNFPQEAALLGTMLQSLSADRCTRRCQVDIIQHAVQPVNDGVRKTAITW